MFVDPYYLMCRTNSIYVATLTFEAYAVADTQKFVLRQRRTRVWGAAAIKCRDHTRDTFVDDWRRVMKSMQSDAHFPMEDCFLQDMPKESIANESRLNQLIQKSISTYQVSWLFLVIYRNCNI